MFPARSSPKYLNAMAVLFADKETAIRIAEAILSPVYGEEDIREQRPYQVTLKDGKWSCGWNGGRGLCRRAFSHRYSLK